jgi:type I restriction enzyme M protein
MRQLGKDQAFIENESFKSCRTFCVQVHHVRQTAITILQHMISKMEREGSRIGVNNFSPFTGDGGSGESDIRKWIIETTG